MGLVFRRMSDKPLENNGFPIRSAAKSVRWGQDRRLEFIDFRLQWDGRVNRSDLVNFFGISVPQASLDFARYMELAPANMLYDRSEKTYMAAPHFIPRIVLPDAQAYLSEVLAVTSGEISRGASFLGRLPTVGAVPFPSRQVNAYVLHQTIHAMHGRLALRIKYQSMNRPAPTIRKISPHAIGFDGFRWHIRAFCHERHDFRDFVFARVLEILVENEESNIDPTQDAAWHRELNLVIAPHPELTEGQKRAIELDYGMSAGSVVVQTREALLFYVLRLLGFDETAERRPQGQQIVLVNREELEPFFGTRDSAASSSHAQP
jgi:WYL domain